MGSLTKNIFKLRLYWKIENIITGLLHSFQLMIASLVKSQSVSGSGNNNVIIRSSLIKFEPDEINEVKSVVCCGVLRCLWS